MTDPGATVVIGLGNPLMGDDGLGLAALARLREAPGLPAGIELVDGGTWGMNLLPIIEGADRVMLLDAIRTGAAPGTVHELARAEIPAALVHKLSPHQIDMREVLALGVLRGTLPAELVAIGIEPAIVEMQLELSPVAEAALPALLDQVLARLAAWTAADASSDRIAPCTS
jgi:hydrogenase maturation protease